jgi:hypothetical protein
VIDVLFQKYSFPNVVPFIVSEVDVIDKLDPKIYHLRGCLTDRFGKGECLLS